MVIVLYDQTCQQIISSEQFNGMPLTFPQANANEKENCRNIYACDSTKNANSVTNPIMPQVSIVTNIIDTNPTTLQVSSIAKAVSNMHAIVS